MIGGLYLLVISVIKPKVVLEIHDNDLSIALGFLSVYFLCYFLLKYLLSSLRTYESGSITGAPYTRYSVTGKPSKAYYKILY